MIKKVSKDLLFKLIECADKLQAAVDAQIAALRAARADLRVVRAELRAIRSASPGCSHSHCPTPSPGCTDLVRHWEDVAAGAGGASASVGLLAAVGAGADWPPAAELGMVGLLRAGADGRVRGLTEDELARWLHATGMGLIAAGQGLVAHSRRADLCATVTHLGRFAQ